MIFFGLILLATTLLLCYAGYIFLVVDKRTEKQMQENPDLFDAIDDDSYNFELPEEVDDYEEVKASKPSDKRTLPVALLKRAMADIPRIEQLEKDHPRMARLFNKGLLPFSIWEQLMEAEAIMDSEVHAVQAEAESLQKGWGQGVFSQAYQMLRKEREEEKLNEARKRDEAVLTMEFTSLSDKRVTLVADGHKVSQQSQMVLRKTATVEEVAFKSAFAATIDIGHGEDTRSYVCNIPELVLDKEQEKQWKQLGNDSTQLRLQVKFMRRTHGLKTGFVVADIRATVPDADAPPKEADDDE